MSSTILSDPCLSQCTLANGRVDWTCYAACRKTIPRTPQTIPPTPPDPAMPTPWLDFWKRLNNPPDPAQPIPPEYMKLLAGSTTFRILREDGRTSWIPRNDPQRQEIAASILGPVFDHSQDIDSPDFHLQAASTLRDHRLLDAAFNTLARGLSIEPDNPELQAAMGEVQNLLVTTTSGA